MYSSLLELAARLVEEVSTATLVKARKVAEAARRMTHWIFESAMAVIFISGGMRKGMEGSKS